MFRIFTFGIIYIIFVAYNINVVFVVRSYKKLPSIN